MGGEEEEEERLPVENSVGYQQFLLQLVEVKGVPINCKNLLLTIWKVKHCKGGGRVSTFGGSKATTNKSSSKSRKKAAASRNKNTSKWNFGSVRGFFFSGHTQNL